jgi:hypothetical protein
MCDVMGHADMLMSPAELKMRPTLLAKRPIRPPPQLSRFFNDRYPDMDGKGGPWISLVQRIFHILELWPPASLQLSPRVDACWTPDRLHVSGSGADEIPIQDPRLKVMAKNPQTAMAFN